MRVIVGKDRGRLALRHNLLQAILALVSAEPFKGNRFTDRGVIVYASRAIDRPHDETIQYLHASNTDDRAFGFRKIA